MAQRSRPSRSRPKYPRRVLFDRDRHPPAPNHPKRDRSGDRLGGASDLSHEPDFFLRAASRERPRAHLYYTPAASSQTAQSARIARAKSNEKARETADSKRRICTHKNEFCATDAGPPPPHSRHAHGARRDGPKPFQSREKAARSTRQDLPAGARLKGSALARGGQSVADCIYTCVSC